MTTSNFPNTPILNQVWTEPINGISYRWDGEKWISIGIAIPGLGESGSQGVQGPQGAQGFRGAQGARGTQSLLAGNRGPQGNPGAQGASGAQGSRGTQGATTGPQGESGAQGVRGTQGATAGASGAQGAQGATGVSSTIAFARSVGTTSGPNPSFRYFRLYNLVTNGDVDYFNVTELEFRSPTDTIITPTWTSNITTFGPSSPVTCLGDGDYAVNVWIVAIAASLPGASKYIQADFGSVTTVAGIRQACVTTAARAIKSFSLYVSNDGVDFIPYGNFTLPTVVWGLGNNAPSSWLFSSLDAGDFGPSTRGELAIWNDTLYGCILDGTPGVWTPLN